MSSDEAPLPLSARPELQESGYSLCLRILYANGVGLSWLRRRLQIGTTARLSADLAPRLSPILGVSADWLLANLPMAQSRMTSTVRWGEHVFTARNHLRIHRPQICPVCIAIKGFCSRHWEPALSTICLEHDCYLTDMCHTCGAQLRWERRALDVCDCGAYIGRRSLHDSDRPTEEAKALQRALEDRIACSDDVDDPRMIPGLPASFSGLTVDGMTSAVLAFGILPRALAVTPHACTRRHLQSADVQLLVRRAQTRLTAASASGAGLRSLRDQVAEAFLRRMLLPHSHPNDRAIALQLLSAIGLNKPRGSMQGRFASLSQLSLFEDMTDA